MHPFHAFIQRYTAMPAADWAAVEATLQRTVYSKGTLLLEEGKVCRQLWFLEAGFLRFFVNKDGEEATKFFTEPPYCFTSQRSFNTGSPAAESIEALEECVVWELSRDAAYTLLERPAWAEFVRQLTQEVQFYTEQILEELQTKTAEERYSKLVDEGSVLLRKVPLKHLASYLGIAPQSLSRIRKKIARPGGS